jgi:hypothetical protein
MAQKGTRATKENTHLGKRKLNTHTHIPQAFSKKHKSFKKRFLENLKQILKLCRAGVLSSRLSTHRVASPTITCTPSDKFLLAQAPRGSKMHPNAMNGRASKNVQRNRLHSLAEKPHQSASHNCIGRAKPTDELNKTGSGKISAAATRAGYIALLSDY